MPEVQYRAANGILGAYFYVFGSQNGPLANAYNCNTYRWEPSTPPPLGNCNWCGAVTNDAIYIIGRYDGSYYNEVQKFTPINGGPTGTWEQVAPYPLELCGIAAHWNGGDYIYAAGGGGSTGNVTNAYRYSISADEWIPIADLPVAMKYHGGGYGWNKFVVYGGLTTPSSCYVYDPVNNTWTQSENTLEPVHFATFSTGVGPYGIYSIGGGGGYGGYPATNVVQIYNPDYNNWGLSDPLPVANGLNSAAITPATAGIMISAGGYPDISDCYVAEFLCLPPPPSELSVDIEPLSTPIEIPTIGGQFRFNMEVINGELTQQNVEIWTYVTMPGGLNTVPLMCRYVELPSGASIERVLSQFIPASFPTGNYMFNCSVGFPLVFIYDSDSFPFIKLPPGDGDDNISNWLGQEQNSNEDISGQTDIQPESYFFVNIYPNPFNQSTVISYKLQFANYMELNVYDISGRQISKLVDGYKTAGTHEVTFDASSLVSGVYFVRLTVDSGQSMVQKLVLMK